MSYLTNKENKVRLYDSNGDDIILSGGSLPVAVTSTVAPAGISTLAEQQLQTAELIKIETNTANLNNCISGNEIQVDVVSMPSVTVDITEADDSIVCYGNDGVTNRALKVDATGQLEVDIKSSALPTGASTEATLSSLNAKVTACDTGAVTVSSSALPTGASTEATLSSLNAKVTACDTGAVTVSSSALPTGASTEATLSTLNGKVTACDTGAVTVSSSALPTGASTEATLSSLNAKVTTCNTGAIAGSVTANAGTNLNTSALALEAGNLATIAGDTTSLDSKITTCNTGAVDVSSVPVVGTHNNSASAQTTVGGNEFTTAIDCQNTSHLSIFGDVDQATDIQVYVSQDNSNWYQSTHTYSALGAQDFYLDITCGARYVRLNVVQTGTTINCTIAGKN